MARKTEGDASRYRASLTSLAGADEADDAPSNNVPIAELPADAAPPPVCRYAYRALDRQHVLADGRLISRPRPDLWRVHGERQLYLTSLLTQPLGRGPALMACADIPDLHHFSGRGAKDVIPLYRSADGQHPNVAPDLLRQLPLANASAEDLVAYVYGVLAHPAFTVRFADELKTRQLRVPITTDAALFANVRHVGRQLLTLHTYNRWPADARTPGVAPGAARCTRAIPSDESAHPEAFSHNAATTRRYGRDVHPSGQGQRRPHTSWRELLH